MIERNLCVVGADDVLDFVFPDDPHVGRFNPGIDFGLLLVHAGAFKTVKEAWAQHYTDDVPYGWSSFTVNGVRVNIYNPKKIFWEDADELPEMSVDEKLKHLL